MRFAGLGGRVCFASLRSAMPAGGRRSEPGAAFGAERGACRSEGRYRENRPALPYCCSSVVGSSGRSPSFTAQSPEFRSEK